MAALYREARSVQRCGSRIVPSIEGRYSLFNIISVNEFSSLGNLGSRLYPYSNNQHPPRLRGGLGWGRTKTIPANLNCHISVRNLPAGLG